MPARALREWTRPPLCGSRSFLGSRQGGTRSVGRHHPPVLAPTVVSRRLSLGCVVFLGLGEFFFP